MDIGPSVVRTRLAPSPSGRMHLGNIWAALLSWLAARSAGGQVLLRLEDLDPERCRAAYSDRIMRDFEWLGLDWDNTPVYQSERRALYDAAFHALEERGLIYPCFCTRAERLAASAPHRGQGDAPYSGRCRTLTVQERETLNAQRRPAWRVCVPPREIAFDDLVQGAYSERLDTACGDFILRRSDGVYAYQLAVVVDDGEMGVTHVVRGADLLSSAPRQIWLGEQLGCARMAYAHVPLLLAPDGRRLAKRDRDCAMDELRARYDAREIVGRLAHMAGLLEVYEPVTPAQLVARFDWKKLRAADIRDGFFTAN